MTWQPRIGERVVYTHADLSDSTPGVVVGYVTEKDEMPNRLGQPIIRWPADPDWTPDTPVGIFQPQPRKLGVTHPHFLWPAWFGRLVLRCGGDFDRAVRRAEAWGMVGEGS